MGKVLEQAERRVAERMDEIEARLRAELSGEVGVERVAGEQAVVLTGKRILSRRFTDERLAALRWPA